jgi:hypothetical protein
VVLGHHDDLVSALGLAVLAAKAGAPVWRPKKGLLGRNSWLVFSLKRASKPTKKYF